MPIFELLFCGRKWRWKCTSKNTKYKTRTFLSSSNLASTILKCFFICFILVLIFLFQLEVLCIDGFIMLWKIYNVQTKWLSFYWFIILFAHQIQFKSFRYKSKIPWCFYKISILWLDTVLVCKLYIMVPALLNLTLPQANSTSICVVPAKKIQNYQDEYFSRHRVYHIIFSVSDCIKHAILSNLLVFFLS